MTEHLMKLDELIPQLKLCGYECEAYEPKDDSVTEPCKYLYFNTTTQCYVCHYTSLNGGASMILSGDTCLKCNHYEPKESTPMIVCKYQNEQNDCIKSSHRTFTCVFARCNAWDAAEARCQYFEHTLGLKCSVHGDVAIKGVGIR